MPRSRKSRRTQLTTLHDFDRFDEHLIKAGRSFILRLRSLTHNLQFEDFIDIDSLNIPLVVRYHLNIGMIAAFPQYNTYPVSDYPPRGSWIRPPVNDALLHRGAGFPITQDHRLLARRDRPLSLNIYGRNTGFTFNDNSGRLLSRFQLRLSPLCARDAEAIWRCLGGDGNNSPLG